MNKYLCYLPFNHISIRNDGKVHPCCRFDPSYINEYLNKNNTIEKIFYGTEFCKIRNEMLNKKPIDGCIACYKEEQSGTYSIRTTFKDLFDIKSLENNSITFLEIGLSNKCNLKCRTCSSISSSSWYEDDLKFKQMNKSIFFGRPLQLEKKLNYIDLDFISSSVLNNLRFLKIVGGESFIDSNLVIFLDLIPNDVKRRCELEIFSNCSVFPSNDIIKRLKIFNKVNLNLSIDAYGKRNDYIRKNSSWDVVEKNAKKWVALNCFNLELATTVSAYNVLYINEILEWWSKISNNKKHVFQIVNTPIFLSPLVLNDKILKECIEKITPCIKNYNVSDKIIKYLSNSKLIDMYDKFLEYTYYLDFIRHESYTKFRNMQ